MCIVRLSEPNVILVSSVRPFGDSPEHDANQLRAIESWRHVADAIVLFNDPQPQVAGPLTRFLPAEKYPRIEDMVDFCADQPDWCCLINADIVLTPVWKRLVQRLKQKRAIAAASWRWEFDPAVGIDPCHHVDNGLDVFAAVPGAWEMVYQAMQKSPQGDIDSPRHLRFASPSWDSWMLGTFFHLFSTMGFYNLTASKCVRHPRHGNRKHGEGVPPVHYLAWPIMPTNEIL